MVMRYLAISLEKLKAAMSNAGGCLKQESLQTDSVVEAELQPGSSSEFALLTLPKHVAL